VAETNIETIYPLSPVQKAILLASLSARRPEMYVEQVSCKLHGDLRPIEFERAWQMIVDRHEPLRTAFVWQKLSEPLQAVGRQVRLPFKCYDWQTLPCAEQESSLAALLLEERRRGFSLSKAPLMRMILIKVAEDTRWFIWTHHHLIVDGWSLSRIISELWVIYEALCKGRDYLLPTVRPYRDYIGWLRQKSLGDAEGYWKQRLKGIGAPTRIGRLVSPLPEETAIGDFEMTLTEGVLKSLDEMARERRLTLSAILQGAWALILHRYTGEEDVVFGATVSGRPGDLAGAEAMVGLFINTVPVRIHVAGALRLDSWLRGIQGEQFVQSQYDYATLSDIHGWVETVPTVDLFESILIFQNYPVQASHRPSNLRLEISEVRPLIRTKYDLTLMIMRHSGLAIHLSYNRALFTDCMIERIARHYETALKEMLSDPERRLSDLDALTAAEKRNAIRIWNETALALSDRRLAHDCFARQADEQPHESAVICGRVLISYQQLNARANQLAHRLSQYGVGPEKVVGVCLQRSPQLVESFLAVLKAGGVYLPLDPAHLFAQTLAKIKQAQPCLIISEGALAAELTKGGHRVLRLDADVSFIQGSIFTEVKSGVSEENAAYISLTAEGRRGGKGVVITHAGLRNLVWAQTRQFPGLSRGERLAMLAPVSADASIFEMIGALTHGAVLCILAEAEAASGKQLTEQMRELGVTAAVMTPPLATLSTEPPDGVRRLVLFREESRLAALERWRGGRSLYNAYGPTETTIWATAAEWEQGQSAAVIGRPVANVEAYVLDEWLRPTPVGVTGELHVGGAGVARGYLRDAALTGERFAPDGFSGRPGARLYRTGDLARYQVDGQIEFVGCADGRVTIRGYRVELGEIEEILRRYEWVKDAVVVRREAEDGSERLAAYVVGCEPGRLSVQELREYLRGKLPDYVIPATIDELDRLPVTATGTIDRGALPEANSPSEIVGARADETVEGALTRIWATMLGVSDIAPDDNLLEMGVNSLTAMQLLSRIRQVFGAELTLGALLDSPTPRAIAAKIKTALCDKAALRLPPVAPVQRTELLPTSSAQQRLWFADKVQQDGAFNVPIAVRLFGPLRANVLREAFRRLCCRHETLRTRFVEDNGVPFQAIAATPHAPVPLVDLSGLPSDASASIFDVIARREAEQPFCLGKAPPFRVRLIRFAASDHALLLTMHHIATDLWSLAVLFREFVECYDAISASREPRLPELTVQYADFACWQRNILERNLLDHQLSYWGGKLSELQPMHLPLRRREASAHRAFKGEAYSFDMAGQKVAALRNLAREEHTTLFLTLLTAFKIVLRHFAATDDVTVATNVSGRNNACVEGLIGYFINHLLLRTKLSDDMSFREMLSRVRRVAFEAYSNQDAPFEQIVPLLRKGGYGDGNPIQVLFVLQNTPLPALEMRDLTLTPLRLDLHTARLNLALFVQDNAGSLAGYWTYNAELYERRTVARFSSYYDCVLDAVSENPDALLRAIQQDVETRYAAKSQDSAVSPRGFEARRRPLVRREIELFRVYPLNPQSSLPVVVEASVCDVDLAGLASARRDLIEGLLLKHGAVLFRGFNVSSAAEFTQAAEAITPNLFGDYGDLRREPASDKVYWSTPYPKDEPILFHNESSHLHHWPLHIWFYCLTAAESGGETPLVDCREVFRQLDSEVIERFETKGLLYRRNFGNHLDVSWQDFYRTSERSVVEDRCRSSDMQFEWTPNGLRTARRAPAVTRHPKTGEPIFFNQMLLHHLSMLRPAVRQSLRMLFDEEDLPRNVYYGDGSPIEDEVALNIRSVYEAVATSFRWRETDVLLVDNMLAAHGRNPFSGARKIMVTMGGMVDANSQSLSPLVRPAR
jgi:amino acid adenylation domain-containing protein